MVNYLFFHHRLRVVKCDTPKVSLMRFYILHVRHVSHNIGRDSTIVSLQINCRSVQRSWHSNKQNYGAISSFGSACVLFAECAQSGIWIGYFISLSSLDSGCYYWVTLFHSVRFICWFLMNNALDNISERKRPHHAHLIMDVICCTRNVMNTWVNRPSPFVYLRQVNKIHLIERRLYLFAAKCLQRPARYCLWSGPMLRILNWPLYNKINDKIRSTGTMYLKALYDFAPRCPSPFI